MEDESLCYTSRIMCGYRFGDGAGFEGDKEEYEAGLNDDKDLPGGLEQVKACPDAQSIRHEVQLQAQCYHLMGKERLRYSDMITSWKD